jgi:(R,R)-butanediol dehydrogenase/meso-butanediol dehydrogenase/diacetyl reductase
MLKPGAILGHEYSGTITVVGEGVDRWKVGDRVVGGGGTPPPDAPSRLAASPRYTARTVGFSPIDFWGGYAEYVLLDAWRPLPIPDTVTDETVALTEPCAIAVHGVRLSRLKVGDKVAIIGAGPIGLLTLQTVKAAGAGEVYVSEPSPARREAAKLLGADHVLDPMNEDVVARLVERTGGIGPDVVFECAGARNTLQQSLEMVRRSGQVLVVSLAWEEDPVLTVEWVGREIDMKTAYGSEPRDWRISLDLMEQGKVQAGPMVPPDSYVPLDGIQQAFESLLQPDAAVQLMIVP